ncbi:RHS repeat domain-containing protein [Trinickia fusca]|uniref:Teneurin-like YD-shell domain-containing protein n=1 Tax=Trinickia fusca TaxID=2419777 RepID=A0A494XAP6_9BURK|nr:RHS repeat-associated core domain-containing protein [Trinickia fusca]RKP45159.1 hypothetical protein D7S89_20190 [Trinickia fusca]
MTTPDQAGPAQAAAVYSNAFNFLSFVETGVDPRTGLYTVSLSLPQVMANGLAGPALPASLAFNPMQPDDCGFGIGWSLRLSSYDPIAKQLRLSSGETYRALDTGPKLVIEDQKLHTFRVEKTGSDFVVTYKSGLSEVLSNAGTSDSVYLPSAIRSPEGRSLRLGYTMFLGRRMLNEVRDDERVLMSIERTAGLVSIVLWPGTPQAATLSLWLVNDRVTELRLPVDNRASWRFEYDTIGGQTVISRVDTPLGGFELVRHVAQGHEFPNGASQRYLPYVIEHVRGPRVGQPPIRTVYRYSARNFLGYGANGLIWVDGEDNLCKVLEDYRYDSVETLMVGDGEAERAVRTTTRVYNRFHLIVSEEVNEGGHVRRQETQYYLLDGRPYADQPAQCQLPRTTVTSWHLNSEPGRHREEVVTTAFDEYGNLLRQVDAAGVVEQYEYYPAEGGEGCPADPLGFARFVKEKRVIPAAAEADAPVMVTRYRYASIPSLLPYAPATVVCTHESLYAQEAGSDRLVRETGTTYFNTPSDSFLHLREREQTTTLDGLTTHTSYGYALQSAALRIVTTITGFDGSKRVSSVLSSLVDGQDLDIESEGGAHVGYVYDPLGRVVMETTAPGTAYEATRSYQYALAGTADDPVYVSVTDANGLTTRTWYDGLHRESRIEIQEDAAAGAPYRLTYEARYDALGRLVEEVHTDWLDERPLALPSRHEYDDWSQRRATIRPDGVIEHHVTDPIDRVETAWLEDAQGRVSGRIVTRRNAFGTPVSIERCDRNGACHRTSASEYDGLGRCVRETDAVGNVTEFAYDVFGRTTQRMLPDGMVLEYLYARHSSADLPIEVRVRPGSGGTMSAGQQTFDGLERLVSRTIGGRRRTFGYSGGYGRPSIERTPSDATIRFEYEPGLTDEPVHRSVGELDERYVYDARIAKLISMRSEGQGEHHFEYSPQGHLRREQWTEDGQSPEVRHIASLQGRPLHYTDRFGRTQRSDYDSAGRLASIDYGTLTSRISYDAFGRIERTITQDMNTDRTLTMTCAYDDFGREIERTFAVGTTAHTVTTQAYTYGDKLARRTTRVGGETSREEVYAYDARGRLVAYRCSGSQPAHDPYGNGILGQRYVYDEWDNFVEVTTEFAGGQNVARYRYENAEDPTQMTAVTNSHADYPETETFSYDADGNLVRASARVYRYDSLGRLVEVTPSQGGGQGRYRYDARDTLIACERDEGTSTRRTYRDARLVSETGDGTERSYVRDGELLLAQHDGGTRARTSLYGSDAGQSVRLVLAGEGSASTEIAYTPYGDRTLQAGLPGLLGFNGEPFDALAGGYLLGNGRRLYDPQLMRFTSPDALSPFDGGGINPYAYCLGDPINRIDPTGNLSWQSILGIAIGVVAIAITVASLGTGVAISAGLAQASAGLATFATVPSATVSGVLGVGFAVADLAASATAIASSALSESDPERAGILGWVSTGFGAASSVYSVSSAVKSAASTPRSTVSVASKRFAIGRSTLSVAASAQSASTQIAEAFGKEPPEWLSYTLSGLSLALAGAGWTSFFSEVALASRNGRMVERAQVPQSIAGRAGAGRSVVQDAPGTPGAQTVGESAASRANEAVRRVGATAPGEQQITRL